ncbi:hypothetical protein MSG28_003172 [Choristoneura fumiferana]|uniref:Uncharacterized protein n=1 Tax=Choristoneura fumiferana TaxID=7141 RepID=A0ACC0KDX5_CHOFU|nr:hypothetical protein MSG28_003172 [Choristoneura fumiferana]
MLSVQTELYGIKWRKLVWGETAGGGGGGGEGEEGAAPLADPVISSYARCLAGDILCVWRRVPAPQPQDIYEMSVPAPPPPPLSLRAAKELWIFWYGEEPDLNGLVAPELITGLGRIEWIMWSAERFAEKISESIYGPTPRSFSDLSS